MFASIRKWLALPPPENRRLPKASSPFYLCFSFWKKEKIDPQQFAARDDLYIYSGAYRTTFWAMITMGLVYMATYFSQTSFSIGPLQFSALHPFLASRVSYSYALNSYYIIIPVLVYYIIQFVVMININSYDENWNYPPAKYASPAWRYARFYILFLCASICPLGLWFISGRGATSIPGYDSPLMMAILTLILGPIINATTTVTLMTALIGIIKPLHKKLTSKKRL